MEYIDRKSLIKEIEMQRNASKNSYPRRHFVVGDVLDCIKKARAADVAPVVRCQECKHWGGVDEYGDGYCKNPDGIDNIAKENDFCSYGERSIKK